MIKDLKIDKLQKFGLVLIFSVAIVCVAMDIVRTIEAVAQHQALYTILEINFVVIISCLPTYRALFNIIQRNKSRRPSGSSAWRSLEDEGSRKRAQHDSFPLESLNKSHSGPVANVIHVTKEIDVSGHLNHQNHQRAPDGRRGSQDPPSIHAVGFS